MAATFWTRTTGRCDNREIPAGTDVAIASGQPDALCYRVDDVCYSDAMDGDAGRSAPIFVVSVPTRWRIGMLVDGETRWIESEERHAALNAIDAVIGKVGS